MSMFSLKTIQLILDEQQVRYTVFRVSQDGLLPYRPDHIPLSFFSFSSKDIRKDTIFIGLRGRKHDGSDFACEAITKGAKVVMINSKKSLKLYKSLGEHSAFVIVTQNTIKAFHVIAEYKRNAMSGIVLCLTGSYGKTTIKEMIVSGLRKVLANAYYDEDVLCTHVAENEGNRNTMIGVMQTICNVDKDLKCLILEVGMSEKGEIKEMVTLAKPDISMLVSVSSAHVGSFNTIQEIHKAKLEVFHEKCLCIVNMDINYFDEVYSFLKKSEREIILYGGAGTEYRLRNFTSHFTKEAFSTDVEAVVCGNTMKYTIGDIGNHIVSNSIAALCAISSVCKVLDISNYESILFECSDIFQEFKALQGRGAATFCNIKTERFLLLDESYNNPPNAIMAMIDRAIMFGKAMNGRTIAVLGDMAELGNLSHKEHVRALTYVADSSVDMVFLVGEHMKDALSTIEQKKNFRLFHTNDEIINELNNVLRQDDVLVVKGARTMALNEIVDAFARK
ncbi:UDP-N-acetylmuramoyl-tripeptide--D-alanyl-D-alanine ligase [Candidatus Fokinia solitaria]|uniref:UDP-N-acetylmuramoyl-tripeptide--D-alanyl-D-alanine ligase n=1 Tax=Candidatus Fokinia solitaria TaxID=1802984 RepID=A0A2U8BS64_9RICK|nr:Mur ligase family protein [Candidatus Fokinia solitaria]AWD33182.1 UDP-N-acetylmuramoyl-tripeptide--D-alanyl-D-alanine ligase [Candidatus Fokinia solitaria]